MHASVVQKRRLVNIHVDSVVRLHLKRGLHRIRRIWIVVRVRQQLRRQQGRDLRQAGLGIFILLRVEVARNPPGGVVAGHRELRQLVVDDEIFRPVHRPELVAEAQSVVEETEADCHQPFGRLVFQIDSQLVVMVADRLFLAPHRMPGLVVGASVGTHDFKILVEINLRMLVLLGHLRPVHLDLRHVEVTPQQESQPAVQHHLVLLVVQ